MSALDDYGRPLYDHLPMLDEAGLVAFLATQPDIVAAYLFGSMAQGRAAAHSDVDADHPAKPGAPLRPAALRERSARARVNYEVRAGQTYVDLKPMYDFYTRDLRQKITEVGLGGRRKRHHQPAEIAG